MLFRKLRGWEWVGILEYHKNLWCIIRFAIGFLPAAFFNGCFLLNEGKSLKGETVFLNFQNISADNFNLVKFLGNTCNGVYFLLKNELFQNYFSKCCPPYFEDTTNYISKMLPSFKNTYFKKYLLLEVSP